MSDDETIVPQPEETTPAPDVTPPAVAPHPEADVSNWRDEIMERIEALTESVNGILNNGSISPDSTPVKKPWTHWGS